jgi:hypothetical protein
MDQPRAFVLDNAHASLHVRRSKLGDIVRVLARPIALFALTHLDLVEKTLAACVPVFAASKTDGV